MATTPSLDLYVKDIIGQAIEQSGENNNSRLDLAWRVGMYNLALTELYLILSHADAGTYIVKSNQILAEAANPIVAKYGKVTLAVNFDKIKAIDFVITTGEAEGYYLNGYELSIEDFLSHKTASAAQSPYTEGIIYIVRNNIIELLVGEEVVFPLAIPDITSVGAEIYYRRPPNFTTVANYLTDKVDAPNKYYSLIVSRIASLIEYRMGVTDKSLTLVKMAYEQLLVLADPVLKMGIIKSLDKPVGELHDLQGHN